jgi:hypothetical protein
VSVIDGLSLSQSAGELRLQALLRRDAQRLR